MPRRTDRQRRRHQLHQSGIQPGPRRIPVMAEATLAPEEVSAIHSLSREAAIHWLAQLFSACDDISMGLMDAYPSPAYVPEKLRDPIMRFYLTKNLMRKDLGLEYHEGLVESYQQELEEFEKIHIAEHAGEPAPADLETRIYESLDSGQEHGYDLKTWTAEKIVQDMCRANPGLKTWREDVVGYVQNWLDRQA